MLVCLLLALRQLQQLGNALVRMPLVLLEKTYVLTYLLCELLMLLCKFLMRLLLLSCELLVRLLLLSRELLNLLVNVLSGQFLTALSCGCLMPQLLLLPLVDFVHFLAAHVNSVF